MLFGPFSGVRIVRFAGMVNDHPPDFSNGPAPRPLMRGPHLVAVFLGPAGFQQKNQEGVRVAPDMAAELNPSPGARPRKSVPSPTASSQAAANFTSAARHL
jgi:hypothetical protein